MGDVRVAGDFDGNGTRDLAVLDGADVKVSLNDGHGNFTTKLGYSNVGYSGTMAVGDFDGDGWLDLALTRAGDNFRVSVLPGKGGGTFGPMVDTATGISVNGSTVSGFLATGDFNSDGKPDIVVTNYADKSVSVLQNESLLATSTVLTPSKNPSLPGEAVTFTATVTAGGGGSPTGTVLFWEDGAYVGSAVPLSNGSASITLALPSVSHVLRAIYSGDEVFAGSHSSDLTQLVPAIATTTMLTSSVNPAHVGQLVTFTATVTPAMGAIPTGGIQFEIDGVQMGGVVVLNQGTASFSTASLPAGNHSVRALAGLEPGYLWSPSSVLTQVVAKYATTTTVTADRNPAISDTLVTYGAYVTSTGPGAITGAVRFEIDGVFAGDALAFSYSPYMAWKPTIYIQTSGTHTVRAEYLGDANFAGSAGTMIQTVVKQTTQVTLTESAASSVDGDEVRFTATVTGPLGRIDDNVSFLIDGVDSGPAEWVSTATGMAATLTTSGLAVEKHTVTALYSGDSSHGASRAEVTHTVKALAPLTICVVARDVAGAAVGDYEFDLQVTAAAGVDVAALRSDQLVSVVGPNGFRQYAQLVSAEPSAHGARCVARYRITPPGGTWNAADEGSYTIMLAANGVRDLAGAKAAGGAAGVFYYSNNPLFSERYYLTTYPDVAYAVARGQYASGYMHFLMRGQYEGRAPSEVFDPAYYLQNNPDVAQAVRKHQFASGFEHFARFGAAEVRSPSALFDQAWYLRNYVDVRIALAAGTYGSAVEHYMVVGQYAGYSTSVYFDAGYYLANNRDVAAAIAAGTFQSALGHYLTYGQHEGRSPIAVFDEKYYLAANADVAAAVRAGIYASGYAHYLQAGQFEPWRRPSAAFDPAYYLARYTDVAVAVELGAFRSALEHYLTYGRFEGRAGHA